MGSSQWDRAKELYLQALELPAEDRAAFLARHCGKDESLRREIEELLGYEDDPRDPGAAASQLTNGALPLSMGDSDPFTPGDTLEGFRIVGVLGRGGMGIVYEAEQLTPRRRVALKILRGFAARGRTLRRLEREAELLARLQHEGIAKLHEAVLEPACGLPFLVMERIEGLPLDAWCRQHRPDHRTIVELLVQLCAAIEHAHQRGVIHRDLKPANILVEDGGRPKILDFGIARLSGDDTPGTATRTLQGELVGTLRYMSPEQAAGVPDAVDSRTDVYSLGVIAYEMLTGESPHQLGGLPLPEAIAAIRNASPRPLRSHDPRIPEDLETIVLEALRSVPDERYASAGALRDDLLRWSRHEPIAAHPPSTWYQLRLFARRRRGLMTSAVAITLSLVVGLTLSIVSAIREHDARKRADHEAERSGRLAYAAQIRAAQGAEDAGYFDEARRLLEQTAPERRGWEWRFLMARLHPELLRITARRGRVGGAFSDDGKRLHLLRGRDLETRDASSLRLLSRQSLPDHGLAYDRRGDLEAIALRNGRLLVRRDGTPEPLYDLDTLSELEGQAIGALHLGPKGARLLIAGTRESGPTRRDNIVLMNLEDGSRTRLGHGRFATWSPDGERIFVAAARLFDRSGRVLGHLSGDLRAVSSGSISPDGTRIALGFTTGALQVIDLASQERSFSGRGIGGRIAALRWPKDGRLLLSGDRGGNLGVWELDGAQRKFAPGPEGEVRGLVHHGHRIIAWSSSCLEVHESDGESAGFANREARAPVGALAYSPDGTVLATLGRDRCLRLWDAHTLEPLRRLAVGIQSFSGLAWSKDAEQLFASIPSVQSFSVPSGDSIPPASDPSGRGRARLAARALAWPGRLELGRGPDPRGRWIPQGRRGTRAQIDFEAPDGSIRSLSFEAQPRGSVFSRDGRWLAVAGSDGFVHLFDGETLAPLRRLAGHAGQVNDVAFSFDGSRLASAGADRTIRLWETRSWSELAVLRGHDDQVRSLAFDPEDRCLASGSGDGTLRVWPAIPRAELVRRGLEALSPEAPSTTLRAIESAPEPDRKSDGSARLQLRGLPHSGFGKAVLWVPEFGPQRRPALLVAVPDAPPLEQGAVHVFRPGATEPEQVLRGEGRGGRFGTSLALVDDLDGDGTRDIAVGSPILRSADGTPTGGVALFSSASGRRLRVLSDPRSLRMGYGLLPCGDLDGDGRADLLVRGHRRSPGFQAYSPHSGRLLRNFAFGRTSSQGLAEIDDLDGDGVRELALVANRNRVIILNPKTNTVLDEYPVPDAPRRGQLALVFLGDTDGDGRSELALGFSSLNENRETDVLILDARTGRTLRKISGQRTSKRRLHPLKDLDGDSIPEFLIHRGNDRRTHTPADLALVRGSDGTILQSFSSAGQPRFAQSIALGDFDGDGRLELMVGCPDEEAPRVLIFDVELPADR